MSYPPPPYQQPPLQPPGFLPYATWQQPPVGRHSGFGIASFIIGMLTGIVELGLIVVAGVMGQRGGTQPPGTLQVIGCVYLFGLLVCVAGAIFGIVGIKQQDRKKLFAILGLCVNGLVLLAGIGLLAIGLAMK